MKAQAVIFDLDGTLVDSLADIAGAMNAALALVGLPAHALAAYRDFVGEGVDRLARLAAPTLTDGERAALVGEYTRCYAGRLTETSRPYPGVRGLCDALATRGVPMAVLSNKPEAPARAVVAALLPGVPFVSVVGARADVPKKPDPQAALALAARLGVAPREIAFVGDTAIDVGTARAAGMLAVGATWGFRPDEARTADVVMDAPYAILALLAGGEHGR